MGLRFDDSPVFGDEFRRRFGATPPWNQRKASKILAWYWPRFGHVRILRRINWRLMDWEMRERDPFGMTRRDGMYHR